MFFIVSEERRDVLRFSKDRSESLGNLKGKEKNMKLYEFLVLVLEGLGRYLVKQEIKRRVFNVGGNESDRDIMIFLL